MSTPELLWLPPPGDRNASLRAVASLADAEDHGPDGSTFWSLALSRFQPITTCIRTVEA